MPPGAILHQELLHELNTDCVEFCPAPQHPDWLVLGSYQLDEKTGKRHGGLDLFRVSRRGGGGPGSGEAGSSAPRVALAAAVRGIPGVFDARWHRLAGGWVLSTALADGSVRLFRPPALGGADAAAEDGTAADADAADVPAADGSAAGAGDSSAAAPAVPGMEEIDSCKAATDMALCLDWAPLGGPDQSSDHSDHVAAVSCSSGSLTLLRVAEGGLRRLNEWAAHELEVWSVAFDKHRVSRRKRGAVSSEGARC